jgi:hypothetical protein
MPVCADEAPSFAKDVAPIFAANCAGCHASNVTMGTLDLDTYAGIQKGGHSGPVIVPGKSGESLLYLPTMSQVTGVPTKFREYPAGTRAQQLPDVQVQSQFLSAFGRPERIICDAGERSSEPNIAQALHVINGDTLNKKLSDANGYAALAVKLGLSDARILDHLFLSAFSRYPADAERQPLLDALRKARAAAGLPEVPAGSASASAGGHDVGHADE